MKVVLDTNVLISGIFFGGHPRSILDAWASERFELLISPQIYDEYDRVCRRLAKRRPGLEYEAVLAAIIGGATLVPDPPGSDPITQDLDDDKFLRCAAANRATVVSGDSHLLDASGWKDVSVLAPADFLSALRP